MSEKLTFHFEGALASFHKMNFYESARFQYAAARLMVKLAQFRVDGKFARNITQKSNLDIHLISQSDGSFNINIEDENKKKDKPPFIDASLADLVAYVSERLVEKMDESQVINTSGGTTASDDRGGSIDVFSDLDEMMLLAQSDASFIGSLQPRLQELLRRRIAEANREQRLADKQPAISQIDFAMGQQLVSMSAPLVVEMATALRKSAHTLEVTTSDGEVNQSVLFLNRKMAQAIETAIVDQLITPVLGNVIQFNKYNGWGKIEIEGSSKVLSFSIPSDVLPILRDGLILSMRKDLMHLQSYFVRDRSGEVIRLIVVGILALPLA